jgi:hypothetical protein
MILVHPICPVGEDRIRPWFEWVGFGFFILFSIAALGFLLYLGVKDNREMRKLEDDVEARRNRQ